MITLAENTFLDPLKVDSPTDTFKLADWSAPGHLLGIGKLWLRRRADHISCRYMMAPFAAACALLGYASDTVRGERPMRKKEFILHHIHPGKAVMGSLCAEYNHKCALHYTNSINFGRQSFRIRQTIRPKLDMLSVTERSSMDLDFMSADFAQYFRITNNG